MHGLASIRAINHDHALRVRARQSAPKADTAMRGHHPDGSGVQLHSAGSLYPFVYSQQETGGEQRAEFISFGSLRVRVQSMAVGEQLVRITRNINLPREMAFQTAARMMGLSPERA